MNLSLKPHPLVSHWIPGMVFLMFVLLSHCKCDYSEFAHIYAKDASTASISILILAIAAFLIGEVFDVIRDLIGEMWLAKYQILEIKWDYLIYAEGDEVERFYDAFFTWYVVCANLAICLIAFLVMWPLLYRIGLIFPPTDISPGGFRFAIIAIFLAIILFLKDAYDLRKEMARISKKRLEEIRQKREAQNA